MVKRRTVIGVMGGGSCSTETHQMAEELGRLIAQAGYALLTGGRPAGVMEAASRGASQAGGLVIGVLPDDHPSYANEYVDIAIATSMGDGRNLINVLSSDVVVACQGGAGTLSEIALAIKSNRPLILLDFDPGPLSNSARHATNPTEAMRQIEMLLQSE